MFATATYRTVCTRMYSTVPTTVLHTSVHTCMCVQAIHIPGVRKPQAGTYLIPFPSPLPYAYVRASPLLWMIRIPYSFACRLHLFTLLCLESSRIQVVRVWRSASLYIVGYLIQNPICTVMRNVLYNTLFSRLYNNVCEKPLLLS